MSRHEWAASASHPLTGRPMARRCEACGALDVEWMPIAGQPCPIGALSPLAQIYKSTPEGAQERRDRARARWEARKRRSACGT